MSANVINHADYKNCVCRNSIVDKLVEECTNVIDSNNIYNETLNVIPLDTIPSDDCASCMLYVALFAVFLTTSVIIDSSFAYWYKKNKQLDLKKDVPDVKYSKN